MPDHKNARKRSNAAWIAGGATIIAALIGAGGAVLAGSMPGRAAVNSAASQGAAAAPSPSISVPAPSPSTTAAAHRKARATHDIPRDGGSSGGTGGDGDRATQARGGPSPARHHPSPTAPATPASVTETVGGSTNTWTDYTDGGGTQGPTIGTGASVQVICRLHGLRVPDGDTWWYRVGSSPWNGAYYASADAFYNDGQTSGSLVGTPQVDRAVPRC